MAYFNDNDCLYSGFPIPEEFDSYPFLGRQMLAATEEAPRQTSATFAGGWGMVDQLGSSAFASTSSLAITGSGE